MAVRTKKQENTTQKLNLTKIKFLRNILIKISICLHGSQLETCNFAMNLISVR